jgi:uncharacterized protein YukE
VEETDRAHSAQAALAAAALDVRAASRALRASTTPQHPDWHASNEAEFARLFERWRIASKNVVAALDQLADR